MGVGALPRASPRLPVIVLPALAALVGDPSRCCISSPHFLPHHRTSPPCPPGLLPLHACLPACLPACLSVLQCGALMSLLLSYLLPIKFNAPSAAVLLAISLHSTLLQCGAQCREEEGGADVIYAGERGAEVPRPAVATTAGVLVLPAAVPAPVPPLSLLSHPPPCHGCHS